MIVLIFFKVRIWIDIIISEKEKNGEKILRDAFGHVRLDELNPGKWFAKKFGDILGANKILIQKWIF